jgi:nucleotide-binding universal stress UspA family protein
MFPVQTILHPTDFSDRSQNALQMACVLAHDYGASLVILHVKRWPTIIFGDGIVPPDPELFVREAKEQLAELKLPESNIHVDRHFEEGDPAVKILEVAKEIQADLIIMGTHGRSALGRLLMGSVAAEIVRKAPCPVLTVTAPLPLSRVNHMAGERFGNVGAR